MLNHKIISLATYAGKKKQPLTSLLICLLVLLQFDLSAQVKPPIQWGSAMALPTSNAEHYYIDSWPEGIMKYIYSPATLFSGAKAYIERYDNYSLLPQYSKPVVLSTAKGTRALEIEAFTRLGDYPVFFGSHYNKDKNKVEVYARQFNLEGEPIGKDFKLAEFEARKRSNQSLLRVIPNNNRNKVLIYYNQAFEKYQNEKAEFRMFDQDMNLVYERFIEFPYRERNFNIYRTHVDENGRVYLLVRIFLEKNEVVDRSVPRYRYSLVTFGPDRDAVEDYNLQMENYFTSDVNMAIDGDRVICAGFYSGISSSRAAGTFFIEIDRKAREIAYRKMEKFEKDFVVDFIPSRRVRRMTEVPDFKVDQVQIFKDGSVALVGEQFYVDEICFRDFRTGMINCQYNFNYNNIVTFKFDSNGNALWTANIPKYQQSTNDGGKFLSYCYGVSKDEELIFLFNDHPRNVNATDGRVGVMTNVRKSVPVMVILSKEGAFARIPLSTDRVQKMFFIPILSYQISPSSAMVYAVRNNRFKIGIVDFDYE
ncbi:MAG: hypothetical protein ACK4GL_04060 [Flavobacteriales bacterium]